MQCENDYTKWKQLVKKCLNKEIVRNAKNRTIINKEFPTLKLFWELGNKYTPKTQMYVKLNKYKINEIRYIFKLRIGCDGSRETLFIRKLIPTEELLCHQCEVIESRQHILEDCDLYRHARR